MPSQPSSSLTSSLAAVPSGAGTGAGAGAGAAAGAGAGAGAASSASSSPLAAAPPSSSSSLWRFGHSSADPVSPPRVTPRPSALRRRRPGHASHKAQPLLHSRGPRRHGHRTIGAGSIVPRPSSATAHGGARVRRRRVGAAVAGEHSPMEQDGLAEQPRDTSPLSRWLRMQRQQQRQQQRQHKRSTRRVHRDRLRQSRRSSATHPSEEGLCEGRTCERDTHTDGSGEVPAASSPAAVTPVSVLPASTMSAGETASVDPMSVPTQTNPRSVAPMQTSPRSVAPLRVDSSARGATLAAAHHQDDDASVSPVSDGTASDSMESCSSTDYATSSASSDNSGPFSPDSGSESESEAVSDGETATATAGAGDDTDQAAARLSRPAGSQLGPAPAHASAVSGQPPASEGPASIVTAAPSFLRATHRTLRHPAMPSVLLSRLDDGATTAATDTTEGKQIVAPVLDSTEVLPPLSQNMTRLGRVLEETAMPQPAQLVPEKKENQRAQQDPAMHRVPHDHTVSPSRHAVAAGNEGARADAPSLSLHVSTSLGVAQQVTGTGNSDRTTHAIVCGGTVDAAPCVAEPVGPLSGVDVTRSTAPSELSTGVPLEPAVDEQGSRSSGEDAFGSRCSPLGDAPACRPVEPDNSTASDIADITADKASAQVHATTHAGGMKSDTPVDGGAVGQLCAGVIPAAVVEATSATADAGAVAAPTADLAAISNADPNSGGCASAGGASSHAEANSTVDAISGANPSAHARTNVGGSVDADAHARTDASPNGNSGDPAHDAGASASADVGSDTSTNDHDGDAVHGDPHGAAHAPAASDRGVGDDEEGVYDPVVTPPRQGNTGRVGGGTNCRAHALATPSGYGEGDVSSVGARSAHSPPNSPPTPEHPSPFDESSGARGILSQSLRPTDRSRASRGHEDERAGRTRTTSKKRARTPPSPQARSNRPAPHHDHVTVKEKAQEKVIEKVKEKVIEKVKEKEEVKEKAMAKKEGCIVRQQPVQTPALERAPPSWLHIVRSTCTKRPSPVRTGNASDPAARSKSRKRSRKGGGGASVEQPKQGKKQRRGVQLRHESLGVGPAVGLRKGGRSPSEVLSLTPLRAVEHPSSVRDSRDTDGSLVWCVCGRWWCAPAWVWSFCRFAWWRKCGCLTTSVLSHACVTGYAHKVAGGGRRWWCRKRVW